MNATRFARASRLKEGENSGKAANGSDPVRASANGTSCGALLSADWHRIQHTWIVPLTVMGPLGVTLLGVILFLLRGDWILSGFERGHDSGFEVVLGQLGVIHLFALCLGAALLASMIVDVEHRSDTWKALFALPVKRWKVYVTKFSMVAGLLAVSSVLVGLGYAFIIAWQNIGPIEWRAIVQTVSLLWAGVLPLVAFQLLLSTAFKNQALPLTAGIIASVFAGNAPSSVPAWFMWRLPNEALIAAFRTLTQTAGTGLAGHLSVAALVIASCISTLAISYAGARMLVWKEIK